MPGCLYRPRPGHLIWTRPGQDGRYLPVLIAKDATHDVRVIGIHFDQQRLQCALSKIPLQRAVTDSLTIVIARRTTEAARRRRTRLEGTGQRQAPESERQLRHWSNVIKT